MVFFFFKQKTAYEILTCDWSSDVCSSDLDVDVFKLIVLFFYLPYKSMMISMRPRAAAITWLDRKSVV